MSHKESNYQELLDMLEKDPVVSCFDTGISYHHPDDMKILTSNRHKRENSESIWSDLILYNKDFTCEALMKCCKFIYWVQDPTEYRMVGLRQLYKKTGGLWNPSLEDLNLESLFEE